MTAGEALILMVVWMAGVIVLMARLFETDRWRWFAAMWGWAGVVAVLAFAMDRDWWFL
jgi:hypothetical protein